MQSQALKLLVVVTILLATASCVSPGKVAPETKGRVVDASDRKPIAGATIKVQHHSQDAVSESVSGSDGRFSVPPARGLFYPVGPAVIVAGNANIQAEGFKATGIDSVRADKSTRYRYCDLGDVYLEK